MEAEVKGSLNDVRQLVADLRPTTLDDLGLAESVRQYAEAVTSRSGGRLVVRTDLASVPPLPPAVEIAAYRIVLEAVTNVTRHAAASTCTVVAEARGANLQLSVTDDGCGLPHESLPHEGQSRQGQPSHGSSAGLGMRSMVERAAELGGRCVIETASGGGTLVTATLPLGQEQVALEQAS
jgi:two-component system NarL family sensor kinase